MKKDKIIFLRLNFSHSLLLDPPPLTTGAWVTPALDRSVDVVDRRVLVASEVFGDGAYPSKFLSHSRTPLKGQLSI